MPGLDFFTISIVSVGSFLLGALAMIAVRLQNPSARGLGRCALAYLWLTAALVFVAINLKNPDRSWLTGVNFIFLLAALFFLDGIRAFREMPRPTWLYVTATLLFVGAQILFRFVSEDPYARTVRPFLLGTVVLAAAISMSDGVAPRDRAVYWGTSGVFALFAGTVYARGFATLLGNNQGIFDPMFLNLIMLVALNLVALGSAFGISLAANLRLQRKAEELALVDTLTNLPNRRMFEERLEQAERRAFATGSRIALIYCDLDDFKSINDSLGHEGGDRALRMVAERMRAVTSSGDCLARVGGDEFLVLLEDAPPREDILAMVERLRSSVEGEIRHQGKTAAVRISCGTAVFPEDVGSATDLIRLADAAMYVMKQHGRLTTLQL